MADQLPKPIEKMLVKDLQTELKKRGLPTKGLKAELVERLKEALESHQSETNGEEKEIKQHEEQVQIKVPEVVEQSSGKSSQSNKEMPEKKKEEKKVVEEKSTTGQEEKKQQKQEPKEHKEAKAEPPKKHKEQAKVEPKAQETKSLKAVDKREQKDKMDVEDKGREQNKRKADEAETADETKKEQDTKKKRRWGGTKEPNVSITPETIAQIIHTPASPVVKPTTPTSPVVKAPVFPKASPIPAVKASSPLPAKKQEPEAPREVPPSKKPVSAVLFITNFVRPFTKSAVAELLGKTGTVKEWEMDSIKSKCYAVYSSESEATATREALHNLAWPSGSRKLQVDYATESDAKRWVLGLPDNEHQEGTRSRTRAPPPKVKTLDDLFRKTTALPHIYYLPLTDSEVEAKKKTAPTNGTDQKK